MTQEDFDSYFERYLLGSLSAEEADTLRRALQDSRWQRRWRELSDMEGMLAEEFKVESDVIKSGRPASKPKRIANTARKAARHDFGSYKTVAAAAVVLLVAALAIFQYTQSGRTATVALLKNVVGDVVVLHETGRTPAQNEQAVRENDGIQAAAGARATLQYEDGTQLTLSGETESRVWLRAPKVSAGSQGKQLTLDIGSIEASVSPQPANRPLVVSTPTSEIKVLGTEFVLQATQTTSRLEVRSGRVRMQQLVDGKAGKAVDVGGGFFAVAAPNVEMAAKPIPAAVPKTAVSVPRALFNGKDMSGWNLTHGTWRVENGVVIGKGLPGKFARIESTQTFKNGELTCKMRVTGVRVAEVQFGGYREFFPLHWETLGVWKELKIRAHGRAISGTLDGVVLEMAQGGGESAAGVLSFYITANATLEIKDAYFTDSTQ